jgi:hypothetical protein
MRIRTPFLTVALGSTLLCAAGAASAQIGFGIGIHINVAPPVLPVYVQPPVPAPGYLWVPGYWAWGDGGYYYWVPGTWVEPPQPNLLWTPGYWGWADGAYLWHEGYWGPTVGFYGGVDYGYGYGPHGYDGGRWDHGVFFYNSAANRFPPGAHFDHVYRHPMGFAGPPSRVSFNGGDQGVHERPTPEQMNAAHENHVMPIAAQRQLMDSASHNREMRADFNHGHPGVVATPRPEAFAGERGEAAHPPAHQPSGEQQRSDEGDRPAGGPAQEHRAAPEQGPTGGERGQEHEFAPEQHASAPGHQATEEHAPSHTEARPQQHAPAARAPAAQTHPHGGAPAEHHEEHPH